MLINLVWDSSVSSAPAGFQAAMQTAANIITASFSDNITLNFRVGYGEISNAAGTTSTPIGAGVAEGGPSTGDYVSYSTLRSSLLASASTSDDSTAYASLATPQDPNANGNVAVWRSQEKALGLGGVAANDSGIDGVVGFGTGWSSSSWVRVGLHEITHAMGRTSGYAGYGIEDLFRFSSAGVHTYAGGTPAYFSINGGVTDLANFSTVSDYGDWASDSLTTTDADNAFYTSGPDAISPVGLTVLDVIGFHRASSTGPQTLTVAQAIAAYSANTGVAAMTIVDTAANVAGGLDTLQSIAAHGNISTITLSDVASGSVSVSAAQLSADAQALSRIAGPISLTVSDTTSLTYTLASNVNRLALTGNGAATITGNNLGNTLIANTGTDTLIGGAGNDRIIGGAGVDTLIGGGGTDTLIGGIGSSTAVYSGNRSQYSIVHNANGTTTITDLRGGSPDGTDTLNFVQSARFADQTVALVATRRVAGDFNADGTSDVLLQNGGTVISWQMSGGNYEAGNVIATGAAGFTVVGKGDVNGDGTADIVLQNGGTVVDWIIQNGTYQSSNILTTGATGWNVVGVGDFNADGTSDVALQNGGTVVDWILNNGIYQSGNVLTTAAAGWKVVGSGDFNHDGTSDMVLQNGGTVVDWIIQNGTYQSGNVLTTAASGWTVVGTGDFNGDGTTDILLQNGGTVVDWIMQNGTYQSGNILTTAASGWTVVGTGDFNGDGTSDVMLQNGGTVVDWIMHDGAYQSGNIITTAATGYSVR